MAASWFDEVVGGGSWGSMVSFLDVAADDGGDGVVIIWLKRIVASSSATVCIHKINFYIFCGSH